MKQDKEKSIFTYRSVYKAYLACRYRKRKTINALDFEYDLEKNIHKLVYPLKTRTYRPGRSIRFIVAEPTVREIFAADFRDRIVHHIFVKELMDIAEKRFIADSYACRKGKGTHAAVRKIVKLIPRVTKNYKGEAYYLQLDISSFFMSIDQRILFKILRKYIKKAKKNDLWKNEMLWLAKIIVFSKPTDNYALKVKREAVDLLPKRKSLLFSPKYKGLPIGNLTSQFFANIYLNELDQYIKRKLGFKFYVRYVDDLVFFDRSKYILKKSISKINAFLKNELGLSLNLEKTKLKAVKEGIDFLGYFIKPDYTLVRKRVVKRFNANITQRERQFISVIKKFAVSEIAKNSEKFASIKKDLTAVVASYFGHFSHANAVTLKKKLNFEYQKFLKNGDS